MNNDDFERQMEFILEQQARFSASLVKQQVRDAEVNARLDRVDRQIEQLVASLGILREALIGLTHHLERHDQKIVEIDRGLQELVERGKETDARLNALLLVVERHISGHE